MYTIAPLTLLIGRLARSDDLRRRVIQVDGVFVVADLLGADRCQQVLRRQRIGDVLTGQADATAVRGVEVDT